MRPAVSDGEVFWVNEGSTTLSGLLREAFPHRSESERASKASRVQRLNPHIRDWNVLHPGQLIALGLPEETGGFRSCHAFDTDLHQLQLEFGAFTGEERKELVERWDFWNALWEVVTTPTYIPSAILASEFSDLMRKFLDHKKAKLVPPRDLILRIERVVEKMFAEVIVQAKGLSLQITSRVSYSIARSTTFVLIRDNAGLAAYTAKLRKLKFLMGAMKAAPYLVTVVEGGNVAFKAANAPTNSKMWSEIERGAADVAGGATGALGGTMMAVVACQYGLLIPSGGTSMAWCSLVGALAGSAMAGVIVDHQFKGRP